jgi:hypothetical protein
MAVTLISHSSLADAQTLDARMTRLVLLRDALDASPVYVRRLQDDAVRAMFSAPQSTA